METPESLRVGVVQFAQEPTLEAGQAKFARFMREAKSRGCRVVVFQEGALHCPADATRAEIGAAVLAIRQAAAENGIYVVAGTLNKLADEDPVYNRLYVIAPDGSIIHSYDKLWADRRFPDVPGIFHIDGVPCCAIICADRWIRSVEELPVFAGAKIVFECSNNFDNEWIADLGWYWYVPRALRNNAFVVFCNGPRGRLTRLDPWPGHGHSAVITPDGAMLAAAGDENDRLLVADLDLARATRAEAEARHSHPLFRRFWDTGVQIMAGGEVEAAPFTPLAAPEVPIAFAAAQMACARSVEDNLARMRQLLQEARARGAQVVAFPALAVTGARDEDILAATPDMLAVALQQVQDMAQTLSLYVAFGAPYTHEDGRRTNSAFVVGPDGALLTRYDQLVVDRPDLFTPGLSSKAMWFDVLGVPGVVTIGRDALWSELAELAGVRGAQLHLHLSYDQDTSPQATLLRRQLWANLASFRTLTATVNAAAPGAGPWASAQAWGGSILWEDLHHGHTGRAGGYVPHSAVRLAEAGAGQQLLCATQRVHATNRQFAAMTDTTNPQMRPWYIAGAQAMYDEV